MTTSPSALEPDAFDALVQSVDLVCITDAERDFIVSSSRFSTRRIREGSRVTRRTDSRKRCMPKIEKAVIRRRDVRSPWLYLL
jgi:hypothetical protein